jgi:hypothetical protein
MTAQQLKLTVTKVSCGFCGKHPHMHSLEIHHMNGDHSDNDLNNLVYLCTECHRNYHHDGKPLSSVMRTNSYPKLKCKRSVVIP